jgi:hypothetical protein
MMNVEVQETHSCTPSERRSVRRYQGELGLGLLVYALLLALSVFEVDRLSGISKVALAVLPMAGILLICAALVRFTLRADEFQRQTILVSAAIAGLVCLVVTMTIGLLENAGLPRLPFTWVWFILLLAFGVAMPFVRRRYR